MQHGRENHRFRRSIDNKSGNRVRRTMNSPAHPIVFSRSARESKKVIVLGKVTIRDGTLIYVPSNDGLQKYVSNSPGAGAKFPLQEDAFPLGSS
jgi:hypothetical protein